MCRGGFIRSFSLLIGLSEAENLPFSHTKRFPFAESFTLCPQKPLVFATKTPLVRTTFYCPQKPPFYVQKAFLLHKPFLLPPKATLFCPPPPFLTTLNLLFAKNTAVLLLFALILCCKAGASHRFKSLPAIPGKCSFQHSRLLDERRSFQKKSRIDRRFESRSQDGVPRAFWLLFARCKK